MGSTQLGFKTGFVQRKPVIGCNDNAVARVDLSNPKKAKRLKSRKLGTLSLGAEWVRVGDELLVAGLDGKDRLVVAILDATDNSLPVLAKHVVDGIVAHDICSDELRGLLWTGTHLLVASYARRLYVVEFT